MLLVVVGACWWCADIEGVDGVGGIDGIEGWDEGGSLDTGGMGLGSEGGRVLGADGWGGLCTWLVGLFPDVFAIFRWGS